MDNKNILIYSNCQGKPIMVLLKRCFPHNKIEHIPAHTYIKEKKILPGDLFRNCDIFIYQPIDEKYGQYSTDFILKNYVNEKAEKVSFPYIYFQGYFPSFAKNTDNGSAPFQNMICRKMAAISQTGKSAKEICDALSAEDLFSRQKIEDTVEHTIKLLKEKERKTDIKISGFIEKNFRRTDLFSTPKHPTEYVMTDCVNQILMKLGAEDKIIENNSTKTFRCLSACALPIYPSVKKILGLNFKHKIIFLNTEITLEDFVILHKADHRASHILRTTIIKTKIVIIRLIDAFDRLIGKIGALTKVASPKTYNFLKKFFRKKYV